MSEDERKFLCQSSLRLTSVNRVLMLCVALLAGFWSGHEFLLGARREGWIYFVMTLTTIPVWASLANFFDLRRQPALGQGFLKSRLPSGHSAEASVVERKTWWRVGKATLVVVLAVVALVWMLHYPNDGHARLSNAMLV